MSVGDEEEEEEGLCLDNMGIMTDGDEGIPIKGWDGEPTFLTHEEQRRMRPRPRLS